MILTWAERCEKFADGEIITERLIQEVMQEEIDELRKEIKALKLAIVEYANHVSCMEGTDFIPHLEYIDSASKESKVLLYELNGYDEHGKEKK